jgi:hypothetical protein
LLLFVAKVCCFAAAFFAEISWSSLICSGKFLCFFLHYQFFISLINSSLVTRPHILIHLK